MAKVIICFVLTCLFSSLSFNSFMDNDYRPLKQWMTYYTEYKELTNALDKGTGNKADILAKLKQLYPEKADQIEAEFKAKYGDLKDSAKSTSDSVESKFSEAATSTRRTTTDRSSDTVQQDSKKSTSTPATRSNTNTSRSSEKSTTKTTDSQR